MAKERSTRNANEQAVIAKSNLAMALFDGGQPLLAALGRVASAKGLEAHGKAISVLINRTVAMAQTELGLQVKPFCKTRATFYRLESGKLVRLECEAATGRPKASKELVDMEAIQLATDSEEAVFIDDTSAERSVFTLDNTNGFKSYIAVPVRSAARPHGLLIADSDAPRTLTEIDKGFLILMAGMLATGLEQNECAVHYHETLNQRTQELGRAEASIKVLEDEVRDLTQNSGSGTP
jgi:putative methionine-R-sulfoxide reductase with GAF domain